MNIPTLLSWIVLHRKTAVAAACTAGIAIMTSKLWCETPEVREQRVQQKRERELRALADRISSFGRKIQQRYPSGDVVVDENDLAQQLHSRTAAVAAALNILRSEDKVQRAPLNGYWKLNI